MNRIRPLAPDTALRLLGFILTISLAIPVGLQLILAAGVGHAQDASESFATWPEGAFLPQPSKLSPGVGEGTAKLTPSIFSPARVGSHSLEFTVGASGISRGGGVMVDFPKAWFTNPVPLVKPVQDSEPGDPHYVSVASSRPNVGLSLALDKVNFDGKNERFRFLMKVVLEAGALAQGDLVTVTFANTTAPYMAGDDEVRVAVDGDGSGAYRLLAKGAPYHVSPGPPTRASLFSPSQVVAGETIELQFTAFDDFYNVAGDYVDRCDVVFAPGNVRLGRIEKGIARFKWTAPEAGFYFPEAHTRDGKFRVAGGPIRVFDSEAADKVYWGDLHSHSRISKDGIGGGDYAYARDATRLDFFASTEHDISDGGEDSITLDEWGFIREEVARFYEPGRFVTFLAYECSLRGGHHNVFFRGMEGVPWPSHRLKTVDAIWDKLEAGQALTIPHHLGIRWGRSGDPLTGPELQEVKTGSRTSRGGPQLDWTLPGNAALRPLLEIYSKHGTSEYYDAEDPLAYEQVRFTGGSSVDGPHYARDAWAALHHLGVVAASDNHSAHPGLAHTGLTAIFAPELTREALFDGLLNRRSYGTTGERILLEFEIAGTPMGDQGHVVGQVQGRILVAGPTEVLFIEVLGLEAGTTRWETVARWEEPGRLLETTFNAKVPREGAVYYLRAELKAQTNGRVARAWSSPIWLTGRLRLGEARGKG